MKFCDRKLFLTGLFLTTRYQMVCGLYVTMSVSVKENGSDNKELELMHDELIL